MHQPLILLLLLVSGCGRPEDDQISSKPELAQVSFDGADANDLSAKIAHGERISWALGCRGCHGKELQGKRFYELYASNLTREVPRYSDAQLERLIRGGVHPTGRDVWAMPSEIFQHLSDTDLAAITSYLRTLKPAGEPTGKPLPFEADAKKLIAEGKILPAAKSVIRDKFMAPADLGETHSQGRYITMRRMPRARTQGPGGRYAQPDRRGRIFARRVRSADDEGHSSGRTEIQEPIDGRGGARSLRPLHAARARRALRVPEGTRRAASIDYQTFTRISGAR